MKQKIIELSDKVNKLFWAGKVTIGESNMLSDEFYDAMVELNNELNRIKTNE